jgi:hypothetical protein
MATDTIAEPIEETKELTDLEREHYEAIKELNNEFREQYAGWEFLKDKTGAAKKVVDEISKRLSYLIARGPDNQQKLPFADSTDGEVLAWREASIAESLGLTPKVLEKLEEASVITMGQLEDLRGDAGLMSIAGIGQATADKIEEQVLEWLTENRDKFGEVVEESEGDEDGSDDDLDI